MVKIIFPDGDIRSYESWLTPYEIASSISSGLARSIISSDFNGQKIETTTQIFDDGNLNDIEFNFHGSFIDPIDSNLEKRFSFYATEVTLNDQNQLTRYYCSPDSISSCVYDEFSLNGVKRSARNYNFKQTLVDESVDLSALPTPFTNTDYEFGIGVEAVSYTHLTLPTNREV